MRIVTWTRDSHGLFDYESQVRDQVQQEFKTRSGALVKRDNATGQVSLLNPFSGEELAGHRESSASIGLLSVTKDSKSGNFTVKHASAAASETSQDRIWRVVANKQGDLVSQASPDCAEAPNAPQVSAFPSPSLSSPDRSACRASKSANST